MAKPNDKDQQRHLLSASQIGRIANQLQLLLQYPWEI